MKSRKFYLIFSMSLGLFACSDESGSLSSGEATSNNQSALTTNANVVNNIPAPCGDNGLAFDDVVAVIGSRELRASPDNDAPRIKNEKASSALGRDHFYQIDNSTTVRRLCVQSEWTEVKIETPDWLTHVKGWVPNAVLREIERTQSGGRVYVEDDILWDEDTSQIKSQILTVVNKIARENQSCGQIDTSSIAKSPSRSKPNDPVFFVTCGSMANAFNVYFRPTDAESEKAFVAKQPIERASAILACEDAAKQAATYPSTVNFSRVFDMAYFPHVSGRARVVSSFSAKNALNIELKYQIDCLFDGPNLIETSIAEATN